VSPARIARQHPMRYLGKLQVNERRCLLARKAHRKLVKRLSLAAGRKVSQNEATERALLHAVKVPSRLLLALVLGRKA
jgi:hypothetical protein